MDSLSRHFQTVWFIIQRHQILIRLQTVKLFHQFRQHLQELIIIQSFIRQLHHKHYLDQF